MKARGAGHVEEVQRSAVLRPGQGTRIAGELGQPARRSLVVDADEIDIVVHRLGVGQVMTAVRNEGNFLRVGRPGNVALGAAGEFRARVQCLRVVAGDIGQLDRRLLALQQPGYVQTIGRDGHGADAFDLVEPGEQLRDARARCGGGIGC